MTIKTAAPKVTGFVGDDAPYEFKKITPIPWNWGYTIVIHYYFFTQTSVLVLCLEAVLQCYGAVEY
ncbi:MAG: hypothetical protein IIV43_02540, partial [Oscillospiraceae bacterium]|nr:hypothetical protein [Oscillospiraceae bacterium]